MIALLFICLVSPVGTPLGQCMCVYELEWDIKPFWHTAGRPRALRWERLCFWLVL